MSRLTRDGTAEPVSRDQILRHARGQGNVHFPCSADHEQDWQPYPVDPYSAIICDDHTYIHTYILLEVCNGEDFQLSMDQPGIVANPTRDGFNHPVPRQPAHSPQTSSRLYLVWCFGPPSRARTAFRDDGVYIYYVYWNPKFSFRSRTI